VPAPASLPLARRTKELCPNALKLAPFPLLRIIEELTREIERYDSMLEKKAQTDCPETQAIRTIHGVGQLTALTFCTDPEQ
jgi:hypothetical protein